MAAKILGGFILIFGLLFVGFIYSFEYLKVADSDNQTAVTNSSRNAMTEAINLGNARVNEEITINEDVAVEATLRMYAASSDFNGGARYVNVYNVVSDPAMIAVESYLEIGTPIRGMLNYFNKDIDIEFDTTRSREITIYEAKETTR